MSRSQRMYRARFQPLYLLLVLVLSACSGDPRTGAVEPKWDRDACERCRMVLSDRFHAAQVRHGKAGERSRVHLFDDIGCAVIWLDKQPWKDDADTQIWVADHRNGEWIDARAATYIKGQLTPMEYGLGARASPAPEGLSFDQAKAHVFDVEKRFNVHGVHLRESRDARNKAKK